MVSNQHQPAAFGAQSKCLLYVIICVCHYFSIFLFGQHAHALELLSDKLTEGASALDVGSGSGYLTACFARMVSSRLVI